MRGELGWKSRSLSKARCVTRGKNEGEREDSENRTRIVRRSIPTFAEVDVFLLGRGSGAAFKSKVAHYLGTLGKSGPAKIM